MAKGTGLLLFGAAAVTVFLLNKGRTAKKLEFYPKNILFTGKGFKDVKAFFIVDIVNPTQSPIEVNSVFANIFINDTIQLGRIEYGAKTFIKKAGTTSVGYPIKLFAYGVGATIAQLILGQGVVCKIVGVANSTGFDVPFENVIPFINKAV